MEGEFKEFLKVVEMVPDEKGKKHIIVTIIFFYFLIY